MRRIHFEAVVFATFVASLPALILHHYAFPLEGIILAAFSFFTAGFWSWPAIRTRNWDDLEFVLGSTLIVSVPIWGLAFLLLRSS